MLYRSHDVLVEVFYHNEGGGGWVVGEVIFFKRLQPVVDIEGGYIE